MMTNAQHRPRKDQPNISAVLTAKERMELISSIGEETTTEKELFGLFSRNLHPRCYDGFEPSGRMHIAQGLMKTISVNKMLKAGCEVVFWVADIFALLNNKMGGNIKKIQTVGKYMIEVWKACGMKINNDNVKFLWASEEIYKSNETAAKYWSLVTHVATKMSVGRMKKCIQILGRKDGDANPLSYLLYAAMQCVDIYFLDAHICQMGMDQRKVNMLAREYAKILEECNWSFIKPRPPPVIVSHHMLGGLKQTGDPVPVDKPSEIEQTWANIEPELKKHGLNTPSIKNAVTEQMMKDLPDTRIPEWSKMSKSDPDSAIFMEDTEADVNRKIKKAFCRPGVINPNPILEYVKYIVLPSEGIFVIQKPEKWGGERFEYSESEYHRLEQDYLNEKIHPEELKKPLAAALNRLLQPVRDHFKNNKEAKKLLSDIKKWQKEAQKKQ